MILRNVLTVLVVLTALSLGACSGGGATSSGLPQEPPSGATSQTATLRYTLANAAGTYSIPPIGGFRGSLALPGVTAPANTRLTLTSSLLAPGGAAVVAANQRRPQATGTLNVYFYETIQLTSTLTFSSLPGFTVTLPASINPAGLQFLYAISNPKPTNGAEEQFRTEGPATLSGHTLTFASSATPLTFQAGLPYIIAFYAVTGVSPTPPPAGTVTEYSTGISPGAQLAGIAAGSDGNLWFCEAAGRIGRITVGGGVSEFSTGITHGSAPSAIAAGPDGNLWFTEYSATSDRIGRITPLGVINEFSANAIAGADLTGITAGPDGNIWFTERIPKSDGPDGGRIGRITPSGVVTKYTNGQLEAPFGITTGPDGNLWFTEFSPTAQGPDQGRIGRITPAGAITEYDLSDSEDTNPTGPLGITRGADGKLWYTFQVYNDAGGIGRITPGGTVTDFPATGYVAPLAITSGPDGNLWYTAAPAPFGTGTFGIARIATSGQGTLFSRGISTAPVAITAGPDGNLWFTESGKIGKIVP